MSANEPSTSLPRPEVLELLDRQIERHQGVITRLANNSVQIKTWALTALAALVALAAGGDRPELLAVALVVLTTFFLLDAYYLSLERHFRQTSQDLLVRAASEGELGDWTVYFSVDGPESAHDWRTVLTCGRSLAISPFYVCLGVLLAVGLGITV